MMIVPFLSLTILCQMLLISAAFMPLPQWNAGAVRTPPLSPLSFIISTGLSSSPSSDRTTDPTALPSFEQEDSDDDDAVNLEKNTAYIQGLLQNLTTILDKWIITGSRITQKSVYNVLGMIESESMDPELVKQAVRAIKRAGLAIQEKPSLVSSAEAASTSSTPTVVADNVMNNEEKRRQEAEARKRWEATRGTAEMGDNVAATVIGRSAFSTRSTVNGKPDLFMPGQIDSNMDPQSVAKDKLELEKIMEQASSKEADEATFTKEEMSKASASVSKVVAKAGGGSAFNGETLGIGGLDDVLAQVKRRVWIPLAAPPQLLDELGIRPVRGLLLYGKPGCGKTLLASKLGQMLSPLRPITIVSGPEVMDKFVGSSEKNLREIFDNPPDIYDFVAKDRDTISRTALHVIIMDEFDAIARARGGRGGAGDQSDAGVARDSVVNQLLVKMDGVAGLAVPTLLIGLTNKRSLIDPALLRAGRFEVHIEIPPPTSNEQRKSILKIHTQQMNKAGRLLVRDAPKGSAAALQENENLPTYDELLQSLAVECDGFSGASLAGVSRAAASHALVRSVEDFAEHTETNSLLDDCVVTPQDFEYAVNDVKSSLGEDDWAETKDDEKPDETETVAGSGDDDEDEK